MDGWGAQRIELPLFFYQVNKSAIDEPVLMSQPNGASMEEEPSA